MAFSPDDKRAYITNFGNGTVSVFDTSTKVNLGNVPVGSGPNGLAVTSDGKNMFSPRFETRT